MSQVEIQEGSWVCIKSPANQVYSIPMLVTSRYQNNVNLMWFLEDRSLFEKTIHVKFLEIFEEENWAK